MHRSVTYGVGALAFRNIFRISSNRVQVALNATSTLHEYRRGKNIPVHAMPGHRRQLVVKHVKMFPQCQQSLNTCKVFVILNVKG